jgi:hypothetical protein
MCEASLACAREVEATLPFLGAQIVESFGRQLEDSWRLSREIRNAKAKTLFVRLARASSSLRARHPTAALGRDYQGSEDCDSEGAHTALERVSLDTRTLMSGPPLARGKAAIAFLRGSALFFAREDDGSGMRRTDDSGLAREHPHRPRSRVF